MKKIVISLRGGLGNQLFQYGFAKYVQKKENAEKLVVDVSYFNRKHIRNLEINKFTLNESVIFSSENHFVVNFFCYAYRLLRVLRGSFIKDMPDMVLNFFNHILWISEKHILQYPSFIGKKSIYLVGYFQDEAYMQEIQDEIKAELKLKKVSEKYLKYLACIHNCKNSIAVSIRIGEDYNKFGWPVCEKEYYVNGLNLLNSKNDSLVFVFADCIGVIEKEQWFVDMQNVLFVKNVSAVEGLLLMAECNDFVIANSTFSWWGAFLSDNDNKKIIAPKFFYNNVEMKNSKLEMNGMIFLDNYSGERV